MDICIALHFHVNNAVFAFNNGAPYARNTTDQESEWEP